MHFTENCFSPIYLARTCAFALLFCGAIAPAKARWNRATPLRLPTKCSNMKYITVLPGKKTFDSEEARWSSALEISRACAAYFSCYVYAYGSQTVEKQKHNVNIRESLRRKNGNGNRERTRQSFRVQVTLQFKVPNYVWNCADINELWKIITINFCEIKFLHFTIQ